MSLLKRTPPGPRCVSELANALCIFQRIFSWALASVVIAVRLKAEPRASRRNSPSFSELFDIAVPPCLPLQDRDAPEHSTLQVIRTRHRDGTTVGGFTFFLLPLDARLRRTLRRPCTHTVTWGRAIVKDRQRCDKFSPGPSGFRRKLWPTQSSRFSVAEDRWLACRARRADFAMDAACPASEGTRAAPRA